MAGRVWSCVACRLRRNRTAPEKRRSAVVTRLIAVFMAIVLLWPLAIRGVSAQDVSTLKVSDNPDLGAILTDAEGKTLYLFTPDTTAGESACNDECAQNWPPLEAGENMTLPAGVPGQLGSIDRADGTKQLTYNDIRH
jgi:predicted lipoprotein with Yx(FWY)xxD motif